MGGTSGEPGLLLPDRVVRVFDGQLRQRIGPALAKGGVERAQFAIENARRPAVRDDVVQGHEQHVVAIGEPDQPRAGERAGFEIESGLAFLDRQALRSALGVALAAEVFLRKRKPDVRGGDALDGSPSTTRKVARSAWCRATRRSSASLRARLSNSPRRRTFNGMW